MRLLCTPTFAPTLCPSYLSPICNSYAPLSLRPYLCAASAPQPHDSSGPASRSSFPSPTWRLLGTPLLRSSAPSPPLHPNLAPRRLLGASHVPPPRTFSAPLHCTSSVPQSSASILLQLGTSSMLPPLTSIAPPSCVSFLPPLGSSSTPPPHASFAPPSHASFPSPLDAY